MNLAVVIHTCDAYRFLWEGWNFYFQKYWDLSLPCRIYFLSEAIRPDFPHVIPHPTGGGDWASRLKRGLCAIPEDYVLYMQDDFWLRRTLDREWMEAMWRTVKSHDLDILRWHGSQSYRCVDSPLRVNGIGLQRYTADSNYIVSHQSAIWHKAFLESCLREGESPWANEIEGTKRLQQKMRKDPDSVKAYFCPLPPRKAWYPGRGVCHRGKLVFAGRRMRWRMRVERLVRFGDR